MRKRPTLKGKGVEIFLGKERESSQKEVVKDRGTFYFPPGLMDRLDDAWFILRRKNRRIRKSDIVKVALEETLGKFEKEGEKSILFKHLIS